MIAIEREFGCGGGAIAERLAGRLGWKLFDRQLTSEIARLAEVEESVARQRDERLDPLLYRLGKVFWRGSYERGLPIADDKIFDTDRMVLLVQQVIERASDAGNCVIVGRGAPWFLRGRPDTLSVFLYAPRSEKIRRLTALGKNQIEAIQLLNTIDDERAAFVKRYFGKEWPVRHLYHAMINTLPGDAACVSIVLNVIEAMNKRLQPAKQV
ncbi:MAG: cytidylate kinase-like family protein [Acidobacteriota bacterium]